jgi:hypothetical protein
MNQKTPYELQIADKLQQLPLPDLQDAIWARIERTLDIDMPTNDDDGGGGDDGPGSGGGTPWWGSGGMGGFVFSMVFVAALTTFVIIKSLNQSTNNGPAQDNNPTNQYILPNSQQDRPPPGNTALPANNRAPVRTNTPTPVTGDSVFSDPLVVTPPPVADSVAATTAAVPSPVPGIQQPAADSTPARRRRGVPVSPNDYRIVPRSDSTRQ